MQRKKTKWGKPKLIVLVKAQPEEMVLAACKQTSIGPGPFQQFAPCAGAASCAACSVRASS